MYPQLTKPRPRTKGIKKFSWIPYSNNHDDQTDSQQWITWLDSARCEYRNPDTNRRCKRSTVIGLHWCWQHLKSRWQLQIKDATLPEQGKGLFAVGDPNDVIFDPVYNPDIAYYDGLFHTPDELTTLYGQNHTAPYGIIHGHDDMFHHFSGAEDGAIHRGVGSMANHRSLDEANAVYAVCDMSEYIYDEVKKRSGLDHIPDEEARCICLKAIKDIRGGDEILVNYGLDYDFDDPGESRTF
jgi:hypothetical protein